MTQHVRFRHHQFFASFFAGLVMLTLLVASPIPAHAQARRPGPKPAAGKPASKTLCVDVATFRQGKPARGLIVYGSAVTKGADQTLLMAVEREQLRTDNPTLFERAAKSEREQAISAWGELETRLLVELKSDELELPLKALYEQELARATAALADLRDRPDAPLDSRFMWLSFTAKECSQLQRAAPEAQRVAVWAWSERLSQVTTRDRADLEAELVAANIDTQLKPPDLSKELPPRRQTDQQWASRLAVVRYTLQGGLDFQGSAGAFFRVGAGQAGQGVDVAPLLEKMMSGQLNTLLKELDPTAQRPNGPAADQWFQPMVSEVETLGRREFRATRLDPDPTGQAASVETAFIAKLPEKGWQIVWQFRETRRTSDVAAEAQQQISQDSQVQAALGLLSALGAGAEAEVKKAVRFGAATMSAQKAADRAFFEFRDRYAQRLDGPPF
ncbi:MAG: hypothetical protein IT423_23560 [Pirellulaceae bacterium]|nr:hypothetical protein [Pirellulaceae bacterium]